MEYIQKILFGFISGKHASAKFKAVLHWFTNKDFQLPDDNESMVIKTTSLWNYYSPTILFMFWIHFSTSYVTILS